MVLVLGLGSHPGPRPNFFFFWVKYLNRIWYIVEIIMSTKFKLNKTVDLYNLTFWLALLHSGFLFLVFFFFFFSYFDTILCSNKFIFIFKGWTYFNSKFFLVFFNYFMKYYHKPPNCINFKNQLIEFYKMIWYHIFKKILIFLFFNKIVKFRYFQSYRKNKKFCT